MRYLAGLSILILLTSPVYPQAGVSADAGFADNSLEELKDKKKILLLVGRTRTVDMSDPASPIIAEALKVADEGRSRYVSTHNAIARKLNDYLKKHRSISAAWRFEDADFIVFFNLLGFRRTLNTHYPHGELFVLVKGGEKEKLQVIWKSSKAMYADDAAGEFIKKLKEIRGEK